MACRVLVVEDNRDIRESLVELLEDHGYDAFGASHGREALEKIERTGAPSLILLDLMMPIMDGRSFREEQLRRPDLSNIPVLIISAHADMTDNAQDLNADGYLRKPLDMQVLLRAVRAHCRG